MFFPTIFIPRKKNFFFQKRKKVPSIYDKQPIPTTRYVNVFSFLQHNFILKKTIRDKTKVFFDTVFQVLSPQRKPFREFETFLLHLDV